MLIKHNIQKDKNEITEDLPLVNRHQKGGKIYILYMLVI